MSHDSPQPAITVTIPGHKGLHIGPFRHAHVRDDWVTSLRNQMRNTAHVPGTTVEPVDYIPTAPDLVYLNPDELTSDRETIADFIRHEDDHTDPRRNFPDAFTLIVAAFGSIRGGDLYTAASRLLDYEAELAAVPGQQKTNANQLYAAVSTAQTAMDHVETHLGEIAKLERGLDSDLPDNDAIDLRHHLASVQTALRAMERIVAGYQQRLAR